MKKMRIFIFLVLSLLLVNCGKEEKKAEENNVEKTEVVETTEEKVDDVVIENEKIKFSDKAYKLFEDFSNKKKDITEKLKSLNKEEANKLYKQYVEDNQIAIADIYNETAEFINSISLPENNFTDKDVEDVIKILNKYSLGLYDLGEGATIYTAPDFYYNIFKDYVTDDYKEYLLFTVKEGKEPYIVDFTVAVPFEEIGERIITLENLLNNYPNTTLKSKIKEDLSTYREVYLLGVDDTLTIEDNSIVKENKEEYDRFMKKYPNSPTVELIVYFLENYKDDDINTKISDKIQEQLQ